MVSVGSTASKGLIGSTNNQWGKCENPTDWSFTLSQIYWL